MHKNKEEDKIIQVQLQIEEIGEICKILNSCNNEFDVESHKRYIDGKDKSSWRILDFKSPIKIHCLTNEDDIKSIKNKLSKFLLKNRNQINKEDV